MEMIQVCTLLKQGSSESRRPQNRASHSVRMRWHRLDLHALIDPAGWSTRVQRDVESGAGQCLTLAMKNSSVGGRMNGSEMHDLWTGSVQPSCHQHADGPEYLSR